MPRLSYLFLRVVPVIAEYHEWNLNNQKVEKNVNILPSGRLDLSGWKTSKTLQLYTEIGI